jgi:hypothetical protein
MVGSATHENGRKEALMSGVMVKRWVGGSIKPALGKVLPSVLTAGIISCLCCYHLGPRIGRQAHALKVGHDD